MPTTMFIAMLKTPIIIEGQSVKVIGPFPSVPTLLAWATKYEVENAYHFPDVISITTMYIPERNERLPSFVDASKPREESPTPPPVEPVVSELTRPVEPPRPTLTLPKVTRGEVMRDKEGRMILRPITVSQYEAAWEEESGYCLACGVNHPNVKRNAIYGECPVCNEPRVMGALALGENGYVLEATSFVAQRSASVKARTTRGH